MHFRVQNAQTESSRQEEEDMDLSEEDEKGEEPVKKKKKFNPDKLREESEEWACQAQVGPGMDLHNYTSRFEENIWINFVVLGLEE